MITTTNWTLITFSRSKALEALEEEPSLIRIVLYRSRARKPHASASVSSESRFRVEKSQNTQITTVNTGVWWAEPGRESPCTSAGLADFLSEVWRRSLWFREEPVYFSHLWVHQQASFRTSAEDTRGWSASLKVFMIFKISPPSGKSLWCLGKRMNYEYRHGAGGVNTSRCVLYWLIWNWNEFSKHQRIKTKQKMSLSLFDLNLHGKYTSGLGKKISSTAALSKPPV